MFSRLATALYNAVDALAPPLPLQEELVWHWSAVTKFYSDRNSNSKKPVEETTIPGHLGEISKILEQEESELERESMGPCMEYFLQNKLLEQMSALARADTPPGMKKCILVFVTRLLNSSKQNLLPQMGVYNAVQKLIGLCGEVLAGPSEREEVQFLNTICQKIRNDPQILNCFLPALLSPEGNNVTNGKEISPPTSPSYELSHQFPLLQGLLTLMESPDSEVSTLAAECLIMCTSTLNDQVAQFAVEKTEMCHNVVQHLVKLYSAIPPTLKAVDIEEAVASWSTDQSGRSSTPDLKTLAPGKRKLLCFFRWLGFVDTMAELSHPTVAAELGRVFSEVFLHGCFLEGFVQAADEDAVLFETTLVTVCLRNVSAKQIVASFSTFLLSEDRIECTNLLKTVLIDHCRSFETPMPLVMATLQIFEELLQRPTKEVLDNLILNSLVTRSYYNPHADEGLDLSDEDDVPQCGRGFSDLEVSPGSSPVSRTFAPTQIHKILNCFLMLLPDEIKSCEESDSGYDAYISDAHRQYQETLALSDSWGWPTEPLSEEHTSAEEDQSSDSQPEADLMRRDARTFEGPFLSMILDRIENMHRQPYDINLLVTSLVSRLALFAHPNLHEYLLNPLIPLAPGARSLFSSLWKVVEEIQVCVREMDNLKRKLTLTRSALLNDSGDDCTLVEESGVLEAVIVIEEFCKELAAVAFVKYHAAS
ncbi:FHF complex subunit HOOK interacting protein 2A-like [Ornithodoros turicata]|uniref:FHF complex subunit HOOK interacting protein 2A-like n=1 Tax=Ornithodoros turicata TaxID=34597 RepID=UPI0031396069